VSENRARLGTRVDAGFRHCDDGVRPRHRIARGGIEKTASPARQGAQLVDVSPPVPGVDVRIDDLLTRSSPSRRSVRCRLRSGTRCSSELRPRCSALLTDTTDVSSTSHTSRAGKPNTSRKISIARCRADKVLERGDESELDRASRCS
jgi:hypothetical protein